jgi:predicted nucleic acid-binding protein
MRDFLIDTNIWQYWFDENHKFHNSVLKRVNSLIQKCEGENISFRVWISSVTWGEIEFGYNVQSDKSQSLEADYKKFIHSISPIEYPIDKHVTHEYGKIRANLFEKYAPREMRKKKTRPEQLVNPITSLQLQIQENDLWIVSQAVTRNFILVTNDTKSFRPLIEAAGESLHIENWAE